MKKCSPSLAIKEMQIKTKLDWLASRTPPTGVGEDAGGRGKGILIHCWWECKLVQPLWKQYGGFLKKLNIDLPYDPAIPLLGIYPKECDSGCYKSTCTPMCNTIHNSQAMETAKMPHY
jgi:hypothetical protein